MQVSKSAQLFALSLSHGPKPLLGAFVLIVQVGVGSISSYLMVTKEQRISLTAFYRLLLLGYMPMLII